MNDTIDALRAAHDAGVTLPSESVQILFDALDTLHELTKPTTRPYLLCLWHPAFDHTCPWCLRHRIAELEETPHPGAGAG